MNKRTVVSTLLGMMSLASAAFAQPIIDTGIYATPGGTIPGAPTAVGEFTVVREQAFTTTPPVMTGSGATLTPADPNRDGMYSQSLYFRSGPVLNSNRDPETEGEVRIPAGVTIVAVLRDATPMDATDATWGLWDAVPPNIYSSSSRQIEVSGSEYARIVTDPNTGEEYIEFRTNMTTTPFTDDFRVLIDYGDGFPPNLELTVNLTTGNDINVGANDGGLTNPATAQVPLTATCAGCYIDGEGCVLTDTIDPTNDCASCNPTRSDIAYSALPVDTTCDDGEFCTTDDVCDGAGACDGDARVCPEDMNDCTVATCDETNDVCTLSSEPNGTLCVGGVCDGADTCVNCLPLLGCLGPLICDPALFTCTECIDTGSGVIDDGCDATNPACVGSDPNRTCAECGDDADCTNGVCSAVNTCVECNVDTDCAGNLVCDTTTNTCEVCTDSAMSIDPGCDATAPACNDDGGTRTCVDCTLDADCPMGVCDTTSNMCVACIDDGGTPNAGCVAATPICLDATAPAICVECGVDTDCASGVCLADNTCAQCMDDGDCAGTQVCNTTTNTCAICIDAGAGLDPGCDATNPNCTGAPGAEMCVECLADADCAAGVCDLTTLTCATCSDTAAGAGLDDGCMVDAPICDTTAASGATCVACIDDMTGADTDLGCAAVSPICDTTGADPICVACSSDATLATDPGCDAALPLCRITTDPIVCVECLLDSDCAADETCSAAGVCTTSCIDATTCVDPTLPVCDPTSQTCVACLLDTDCTAGVCSTDLTCVDCVVDTDCDAGVCSVNICVECVDTADCADGFACSADNVCVAGCLTNAECAAPTPICSEMTCVECGADADCDAGATCVENACVPGGCVNDADCPADAPICDTPTCVECSEDTDCALGATCAESVCVDAPPECVDNSDCDDDLECVAGTCETPEPDPDMGSGNEPDMGSGSADYELSGGCATPGNVPADAFIGLFGLMLLAWRRRR